MYFVIGLMTLLTSNLILTQALGTSTLFIAAGNRKNLAYTALTITFFTTAGSALTYLINQIMPESMKDFRLLLYSLSIGILYMLLLMILYFVSKKNFKNARKYVHLSAFNCAVMGTFFNITEKAAENPQINSIGSFLLLGAGAGLGFLIAAFILMAAYQILNSADVPASFRGFPAMLLYLGIISMAVYALS